MENQKPAQPMFYIQNKHNAEDKRIVTQRSWFAYEEKFFQITEEEYNSKEPVKQSKNKVSEAVETKKKQDAAHAAVVNDEETVNPESDKIDLVGHTTSESSEEFATVDEFGDELEGLREQYELKTGKPADKRWKASRIQQELEKL